MSNDLIQIEETSPAGKPAPKERSAFREFLDSVDGQWAWTVTKILLVIFAFMTGVWAADYFGSPGLQVGLFYITLILAIALALSAKLTVGIFILGSALSREKGQTLFAAGSDTVKQWWTKGAPGTILGLMLFQGFFIIWPWSYQFGLFWFAIGAGLIFFVTMWVYAIPAKWMPYIVLPISLGAVLFTLLLSATGMGLPSNFAPMSMDDMPIIGGQSTQTAAPVKATASNSAPGYLDPIVVSPGTTSPEVANSSTQLQVCNNLRPSYVKREVKLQTGEWIDSSQQGGRTVIAVRVINNGTVPFIWNVWRQSPQQPC